MIEGEENNLKNWTFENLDWLINDFLNKKDEEFSEFCLNQYIARADK